MQMIGVRLLVLAALGGCQVQTGRLLPEPSYPVPVSVENMDRRVAAMKGAEVVVAGIIDGEPRRVARARKSPIGGFLDYVHVPVRVEVSVRGGASGSVGFGAYCYSMENDRQLGVLNFQPKTGERRIFFLRRENGELRSVGDVLDYSLLVYSGSHRAGFCSGMGEGRCLTELLLRPQQDASRAGFVRNLMSHSTYAMGLLSSPEDVKSLLGEMAGSSDFEIASRAKDVLGMAAVWWPK